MDITFHLETFTGPLDLLLSLISKNKVSIIDIPIALILEQYLEYLDQMKRFDIAIASDFVAMAAQLTYIKSKMLLPKYEDEEEEDPRATLVEALLEYQRIKQAGEELSVMGETGRDIFTRNQEKLEKNKKFEGTLDIKLLKKALANVYEKAERSLPPPISKFSGIVGRESVSVNDKIAIIVEMFIKHEKLYFSDVVKEAKTRSDIVAIFLAVLELTKVKKVEIEEQNGDYIMTLSPLEKIEELPVYREDENGTA